MVFMEGSPEPSWPTGFEGQVQHRLGSCWRSVLGLCLLWRFVNLRILHLQMVEFLYLLLLDLLSHLWLGPSVLRHQTLHLLSENTDHLLPCHQFSSELVLVLQVELVLFTFLVQGSLTVVQLLPADLSLTPELLLRVWSDEPLHLLCSGGCSPASRWRHHL